MIKNSKNNYLFQFFNELKPFVWLLFVVFLCNGFITLIGMLPPLFSVIFFDYAYPNKDLFTLTVFILVSFSIYFLDFIFSVYIDYLNIYVHQSIDYNLTLRLFQKIENIPIGLLNRIKIGDMTVRLTDDIGMIVRFLVNSITDLLMTFIKLVVFLYITLSFDYKVTLLALLSIPLYIIETKFFSKKLEDIQQGMQEADSDIIDGIQSKLINIRTIKAFTQQMKEADELGIRLRKSFFLSIKESIVSIFNVFTNSVTIQVWSTFIGWYLGYEVINNQLSIGELVALSIYLPMLEGPIRELADAYRTFRITGVSSRRVMDILKTEEEEAGRTDLPTLRVSNGQISFNDISFGYEDGILIIDNFRLDIPANSSAAFVGDSGSGKSTLLNLILRFFKPNQGRITIDGQDIMGVDIDSLRREIGVVFQETAVMPGTIRDNILYGMTDVPDGKVIRAATDAHAHEFIENLPDGYNTVVLPGGRNLSGGQQQRLAIARAMLRDPKILILDEPTSALDSASEFLIQESISRLIGTRTIIIVAHRLSTIKRIDNIVVISKGRIVEQGSFNELLEKKEEFFRLYNLQFGGFQKFVEMFNTEFQRFLRYNDELSLAMIEIPEFDHVSQSYHPNVAANFMEAVNFFIRKRIRIMDDCSVYHAGKIVVCFPATASTPAVRTLERLGNLMKSEIFDVEGEKIGVSFRAGIVSCKEIHAQYGEDLFEIANTILSHLPKGMNVGSYGDIIGAKNHE